MVNSNLYSRVIKHSTKFTQDTIIRFRIQHSILHIVKIIPELEKYHRFD